MIPKDVISSLAQMAGFGGIDRVRCSKKLDHFAELVVSWEYARLARIYDLHAHQLSLSPSEYNDGKMDGFFSAADMLKPGNNI